jgi:peptide-methionine (S)-S-oxide reductase
MKKATFGAGCFWGVEASFMKLEGVISTKVGYMGGNLENPTYEQVCSDKTGHVEVVQLGYDPKIISYHELLENFWNIHDPTQKNKQGPDVGTQYKSIIFYHDEEQKRIAEKSKKEINNSSKYKNEVQTEIKPSKKFWIAEEYHQKYFEKNPNSGCKIR